MEIYHQFAPASESIDDTFIVWSRYILPGKDSSKTNPAPFLFANGTILLGTRRTGHAEYPSWIGHTSSPSGPWVPLQVNRPKIDLK